MSDVPALSNIRASGPALSQRAALMFAACLFGLAAGPPAVAANVQGRCVLSVAGTTYIDGPCEIDFFGGDGSFSALQLDPSGDLSYFAYVLVIGRDVAEGHWNGERGASHAHTPLGTLQRRGGCWINETARVCAWR